MLRIGLGYDIHRLVSGRSLILGGVTIPHEKGLEGHSDADALCHAITDALLGALAFGDIGSHFPNTEERFRGANSLELLKTAHRLVRSAGYQIVNLDANIIAERPKLQPFVPTIRMRLAEALDLTKERISVKAKTKEHVGPEGNEEAISTQAVVLLEKKR